MPNRKTLKVKRKVKRENKSRAHRKKPIIKKKSRSAKKTRKTPKVANVGSNKSRRKKRLGKKQKGGVVMEEEEDAETPTFIAEKEAKRAAKQQQQAAAAAAAAVGAVGAQAAQAAQAAWFREQQQQQFQQQQQQQFQQQQQQFQQLQAAQQQHTEATRSGGNAGFNNALDEELKTFNTNLLSWADAPAGLNKATEIYDKHLPVDEKYMANMFLDYKTNSGVVIGARIFTEAWNDSKWKLEEEEVAAVSNPMDEEERKRILQKLAERKAAILTKYWRKWMKWVFTNLGMADGHKIYYKSSKAKVQSTLVGMDLADEPKKDPSPPFVPPPTNFRIGPASVVAYMINKNLIPGNGSKSTGVWEGNGVAVVRKNGETHQAAKEAIKNRVDLLLGGLHQHGAWGSDGGERLSPLELAPNLMTFDSNAIWGGADSDTLFSESKDDLACAKAANEENIFIGLGQEEGAGWREYDPRLQGALELSEKASELISEGAAAGAGEKALDWMKSLGVPLKEVWSVALRRDDSDDGKRPVNFGLLESEPQENPAIMLTDLAYSYGRMNKVASIQNAAGVLQGLMKGNPTSIPSTHRDFDRDIVPQVQLSEDHKGHLWQRVELFFKNCCVKVYVNKVAAPFTFPPAFEFVSPNKQPTEAVWSNAFFDRPLISNRS